MLTIRKVHRVALLLVAIVSLFGCSTRSISNSDYSADPDRGYSQRSNPFYKGELNELDVIGIDSKTAISEEDIAKATASKNVFQ